MSCDRSFSWRAASRAARVLLLGAMVASGHAAAQPPIAKSPPLLKRGQDSQKVSTKLTIRPGVPEPQAVMTITVELAEILKTPDPRFGTRRPIDDAALLAYLVGQVPGDAPPPPPEPDPAKKGKKKKGKGEPEPEAAPPPAPPSKTWIDARAGFRLGDAGTYAITFNAPAPGLYGLYLRGNAPGAGPIAYDTLVSFGVWPVPEGSVTPPLPTELPPPTPGNLINGRNLCRASCRTDHARALPKGASPAFLESGWAASLSPAALIKELTRTTADQMSAAEQNDLVTYLHSLHFRVRELFPEASAAMPASFTINDHGVTRLEESLARKLTEDEKRGIVFVVYKDGPGSPAIKAGGELRVIDFNDRVARDQLDAKSRLGYAVFFRLAGHKDFEEIGFGLDREPHYTIKRLVTRKADGSRDDAAQADLKSFVDHGKFNDPKSLDGGSKKLLPVVLPLYLRAAELATMYLSDEREFTAFDGEFGIE